MKSPRAPSNTRRPTRTGSGPLSPVLLIGAGTGEATCGILYLAGYLRRGGIEAFVRLYDADETDEEILTSLEGLVSHVRPRVVGISFKWFHHVARALRLARLLRAIDPSIRLVFGGNSASYFWSDLIGLDCVDDVVLGDGELPLLRLCQADAAPPNVVNKQRPKRDRLAYVESTQSTDVYYSHFDQIFLNQLDRHAFSGWVAPGKGCAENCVYCGGGRGLQGATFGRAKPFLRADESVHRDHQEIAPFTWQMRYDFAGSTAEFLERAWAGVDLSHHSTTFFLWGIPAPGLIDALAKTFRRVFMVLDIGCFSESQRQQLMKQGLLKPCPTDSELMGIIESSQRHPNLTLEISGIAGLPLASAATLAQERRLMDQVLRLGCGIGYQRLESQPGALVTEHPKRFGMVSEARTFTEFLDYFEAHDLATVGTVPMIRFLDEALEAEVQDTCDALTALARDRTAAREKLTIAGRTRLRSAAESTQRYALGEWLGAYRVPARMTQEPVTVVRSSNGTVMACAPTIHGRGFADPTLDQGEAGAALLAVLGAFDPPTTVEAALKHLRATARLDGPSAREVVEHLAAGRFLQPA